MQSRNLLENLLAESPALDRLYTEIVRSQSLTPSRPRIVACGLLKAGKSSLLNALTGHLAEEFFATGASRTTAALQEAVVDGLVYVDAPGIDASEADDDEAWRGLEAADVLLFVHNMRTGVLDALEETFLQQLRSRRPDAHKWMIVALTHLDSAGMGQEERCADIRSRMTSIFGACPPLVSTSYTAYCKGVQENKPRLVTFSGIAELQKRLITLCRENEARILAARAEREQLRATRWGECVDQLIALRQQRLAQLPDEQVGALGRLKQSFDQYVSAMRARIARYDAM